VFERESAGRKLVEPWSSTRSCQGRT